jgi:hypothetical protein
MTGDSPVFWKDLRLIEALTNAVESCRRFVTVEQGRSITSSRRLPFSDVGPVVEVALAMAGSRPAQDYNPPETEVEPNDEGSYCPLPPLWRFPWEQSEGPRPARMLSFVSGALAVRRHFRQARSAALVVMIALVLGMAGVAQAQQEVAPDHFDNDATYVLPHKATRNVTRKKSRRAKKIANHRSGLNARAHRASQARDGKAGGHSAS